MRILNAALLVLLSGCYSTGDQAYLNNTRQQTSQFIATTWPDLVTQDAIVDVQVGVAYRGDGTFNPFAVLGSIDSTPDGFDEVSVGYAAEKATAQTFLPGLKQFCRQKGRPMKVLWDKPPKNRKPGTLGSVHVLCQVTSPTRNLASGVVRVW